MCPRLLASVAVLAVLAAAASAEGLGDVTTLQPDDATAPTGTTAATTTFAGEETATDAAPMMVRVEIPAVSVRGAVSSEYTSGDIAEKAAEARRLDGGIGLPLAMMGLPSPSTLRGPVVVAAPNATAATLPPPPMPLLDTDEDFMTDMQEIETDMVMAERSVSAVPAAAAIAEEEVDEDMGDIPANHKKSSRVHSSAEQNSLLGTQSRFATAPPQEDNKYEMMMAKLPIKDYSVTGRDKPVDVVFVFPRANETRQRELEVVLVFPQGQNATKPTAATEAPSAATTSNSTSTTTEASSTASSTSFTTTSPPTPAKGADAEEDERLGMASERKETTADVAAPSPTRATAALNRPRTRQDIYKKYANKYASSRPPPVSFFRKDDSKSSSSVEEVDLDTGASEAQPSVLPPPGPLVPMAPRTVMHWPLLAPRLAGGVRLVRLASPRPGPVLIPARMQATRPAMRFPSLPPSPAHAMLVAVPPQAAISEDVVAAPSDALASAPLPSPVPTPHRGAARLHAPIAAGPAEVPVVIQRRPDLHQRRRPASFADTTAQRPVDAEVGTMHARPDAHRASRLPTPITTTLRPAVALAEAVATETTPAGDVTTTHGRFDALHRFRRPISSATTLRPAEAVVSETASAAEAIHARPNAHRFPRPTTTTTTPSPSAAEDDGAEAVATEASPAAVVTATHARPDSLHRFRRPTSTTPKPAQGVVNNASPAAEAAMIHRLSRPTAFTSTPRPAEPEAVVTETVVPDVSPTAEATSPPARPHALLRPRRPTQISTTVTPDEAEAKPEDNADTLSDAAAAVEAVATEAAVAEASTPAGATTNHVRFDTHRFRRPISATATPKPANAETISAEANSVLQAEADPTATPAAEAVQGLIRHRPMRNRPTTASAANDANEEAATPRPAFPPRARVRGPTHSLQASHTGTRPGHRDQDESAAASSTVLPAPIHSIAALRNRSPGARRQPGTTSTSTPSPANADVNVTTPEQEALTGEELATIHNITALQEEKPHGGAEGRMRQERLSTLRSMLVSNLMSIQKELAERHADMRRHVQSSLHLPAEHRTNARALHQRSPSTTASPVTPSSTTVAPKKYRRPPAFRKSLTPVEDKEQGTADKASIRMLYKKRNNPVIKLPSVLTTTAATTVAAGTTDAAHSEDVPAATESSADRDATVQPAASTDSTVTALSATTAATPTATRSTPTKLERAGSAATASPPLPPAATAASVADREEEPAAGDAKSEADADPAPLESAASEIVELGGFQPSFLASPKDPVHRPSRLALLAGVLPEDDPALASGLFRLERRERGTFRAPQQLEGGFLPVVPSSVAAAAPSAPSAPNAPQIVGPIPTGYREVLRGTPVQLDLPRAERPNDFLGRSPPQLQLQPQRHAQHAHAQRAPPRPAAQLAQLAQLAQPHRQG